MPLGRSRKIRWEKLNGTHQLLVYAHDVNMLGDNIDTIKKNTETLIDAIKDDGLEVNAEKTKYMLLSRHQIANRSFENAAQFKYFLTTITNQNLILEEMKTCLNSGNACYHSTLSSYFEIVLSTLIWQS
jgi:biotin operon repressor